MSDAYIPSGVSPKVETALQSLEGQFPEDGMLVPFLRSGTSKVRVEIRHHSGGIIRAEEVDLGDVLVSMPLPSWATGWGESPPPFDDAFVFRSEVPDLLKEFLEEVRETTGVNV